MEKSEIVEMVWQVEQFRVRRFFAAKQDIEHESWPGPGPGFWIEIVLNVSFIGLLVFSLIFIAFLAALCVKDGSKDAAELEALGGARVVGAIVVLRILAIGICLLSLAGGIRLVQGVNEENPSKFQCWLIIQGVCIGFTVLKSILILTSGAYGAVTWELITILIRLFCFWVVNLHRKELLNAGRTGSGSML